MAAIGEIVRARRAGTIADNIVTPIPTAVAHTTVRGASTRGPAGSEKPTVLRRFRRPVPSNRPSRMPDTVEKMPTNNASRYTERLTCWPVAPIARKRPSSRMR